MKRLWVVDDMIPFAQIAQGPMPLNLSSEMIRHLLNSATWEDDAVKELCKTIVDSAEYEAMFFISPAALIEYLDSGVLPPDAVIFDWEYGSSVSQDRVISWATRLLQDTIAIVQIYTHLEPATLQANLSALKSEFSTRLLDAQRKADVLPQALAEKVRQAWNGTLTGAVATDFRRKLRLAAEVALKDLASIPTAAVGGLSKGSSENLLALLLARVREELALTGADLFDIVKKAPTGQDSGVGEAIRRLLSFWYYVCPTDTRVRRGDIVQIDGEGGVEFGLVVTSPCDLSSFSKKTGNVVTWIHLKTISDVSAALGRLGFKPDRIYAGASIAADVGAAGDRITLLPNVPKTSARSELLDLVLLAHEWRSQPVERPTDNVTPHLLYADLPHWKRLAMLSEPFLSAVVARAVGAVISPGLPDMPVEEKDRLSAALKLRMAEP